MVNFTESEQRETHVCQWSKVAGCAERSLRIDHRYYIGVEQIDEPLDGRKLDSGISKCKRFDFQQKHKPDNLRINGLAATTRV